VAKRVIMQVSVILHLERFLVQFRWGRDFSKADIRFGLYNFLGNLAFIIIFLIFLDDALRTWELKILSDLLQSGILFLPKIIFSFIIFGLGVIIAASAERATYRALRRENIPRAAFISRFAKTGLLLVFAAMALVELDIARQIVIIGFATIIVTLGALTVVLAALGGREFLQTIRDSLEEKRE